MQALIDFADPADAAAPRLRRAFGAPQRLLVAHEPAEVRAVLDAAHAAACQGAWCVGFVRYEAAPAFDAALQVHPADGPLAWFAVHDTAQPWPEAAVPGEAGTPDADAGWGGATLDWPTPLSRPAFDAALARIQQAIADGELYQVNHTARLEGRLRSGEAHALFAALQRAQPGGYAACLDTGAEQVLSVSPELFFDWRGGTLLTRPMKGTAARGATPAEDAERAAALRASPKERAENVMVVDLLRNDLSRVALPHSVQVPQLFRLQALPTVWQMTSDVVARSRPGTRLSDVFAALFPCGSVTGAPKVQAMRLSRALEAGPRGVYCGAVGVLQPGGAATFNVAIRTVTLHAGGVARCGIGSGITAGAQADGEWREWRHKRAFLERASAPFDLLETLALAHGACRHADAHLARLGEAAAHFGVPWSPGSARAALAALEARHPQGLWRVRLLLDRHGRAQAEAFEMAATETPVRLALADTPFEMADSEFVRFKTTRRAHYDAAAPHTPGVFDTILWNERGELTECTRGNLALRLGGRWLTPALHCGLLPGIGRALALREGRLQEAVLTRDDLARAEDLAFVNSLRGWLPAQWVDG